MRTLSKNKTRRLTVSRMIVEDLGYCCEYKFFSLYKDTPLIAARLGVDERTVRKHKAALAEGRLVCKHASNCMLIPRP